MSTTDVTGIFDEAIADLLVCSQCKASLECGREKRVCSECGRSYGRNAFGVWDFMLTSPESFETLDQKKWRATQVHYEEWAIKQGNTLTFDQLVEERDTVLEVYRDAFHLKGSVLDVGGHQGRLRHFLPEGTTYLSVDPFADVFHGVSEQEALLRAYPCLRTPTNLVQAQAEFLPIRSGSFEFVHMRSVLDHFFDPTMALREARRVLQPNGRIVIGVFATGGGSSIRSEKLWDRLQRKVRREGVPALLSGVARRVFHPADRDEHLWHPTFDELVGLLGYTGFEVETVHWQRPPLDHVLWIQARRSS